MYVCSKGEGVGFEFYIIFIEIRTRRPDSNGLNINDLIVCAASRDYSKMYFGQSD